MEAKQPGAPVSTGIGGMDNVVPQTPPYFTYIRYAQIVLTLVVFICSCVSVSQTSSFLFGWGGGFGIFTAIWTFFFLAAVMLIPIYATNYYYKWPALIAEAFCVLWWLVTFAGLAVWATALSPWANYDDSYDGFFDSYAPYKGLKTAYGACAAGAAFGAFNWIAFCVTFVLFGLACNKARIAKRSYGVEGGNSMGPIGTQQPAPVTYDNSAYPQQPYPSVPTPAPQQPYHQ